MTAWPGLSGFAGRWHLTRAIEDRRAGATAHFDGIAEFRPDAEGLIYHETGTLYLAGQQPMKAERRYLWREQGDDIAVFFDDGRFFHRISQQNPQDNHWCDPDQYDVSYDFTGWPGWQSTWRVKGPKKDYLMQSDYSPFADRPVKAP